MTPDELKAWMEEHDYNNRELGEALDVHQVTVAKWRSGEQTITYVTELALGNPALRSRAARATRVRQRSPSERVRRERMLAPAS